MDAIVLRALAKALECANNLEIVMQGADIARETQLWIQWRNRQRQASVFHDYLLRKLEQGRTAKAEVAKLREELDECRGELLAVD